MASRLAWQANRFCQKRLFVRNRAPKGHQSICLFCKAAPHSSHLLDIRKKGKSFDEKTAQKEKKEQKKGVVRRKRRANKRFGGVIGH